MRAELTGNEGTRLFRSLLRRHFGGRVPAVVASCQRNDEPKFVSIGVRNVIVSESVGPSVRALT